MIKSIKELSFNEEMKKTIKDVEGVFNAASQKQGSKISMIDWINVSLAQIEEQGVTDGWTDREKFLFAFAMLTCLLQEELES